MVATSEHAQALLQSLPGAVTGQVAVRLFDEAGELLLHAGHADEVGLHDDAPPAGRATWRSAPDADGQTLLVSFEAAAESTMRPMLDGLFGVISERNQLERDLESMYPSSLALLEEVSLVGELLVRLPTCQSEEEIVEMALSALVLSCSVERAVYVRRMPGRVLSEVFGHVAIDERGRKAERVAYDGEPLIPDDEGILGEAVGAGSTGLIRPVPAGGFGDALGPEHLARRQVLATPVRYGPEGAEETLGVLLLMDRRTNSWSTGGELGSQEAKTASSIGHVLGSVIGARRQAEAGKELQTANQIAQQILPDGPATIAGYDLAGHSVSSGAVGGDYFDYLPMCDGRTLVVVADVSGHNLASGMIMVGARSTLRVVAAAHDDPARIFDELHRALYPDMMRTERFLTAVGVALRPDSNAIEIVNAGHNDTMVLRVADGSVERIGSRTTVIGFLPEPDHEKDALELQPGDVCLIYTDGVTEATAPGGEMYGEERLAAKLAEVGHLPAGEILEAVFNAVRAFADEADAGDDVSAVVIKRNARADGGDGR